MAEINPKQSLFGRHSYPREQLLIISFINDVQGAVTYVEPLATAMPEFIEKFPLRIKMKKIKQDLSKARSKLEEIGVS